MHCPGDNSARFVNVQYLRHLNDEFTDGNHRALVLRPYLYNLELPVVGYPSFSLNISTLILDSVIWISSLGSFFECITIPGLQSLTMMPPDPYATRKYWDPVDWTNSFTILPSFLVRSGCALQTFAVIMRGRYVDDIDSSEGFFNPVSTEKPTLEESLIDALHSMKNLRALRVIEAELGPSLFSGR